VPALTALQTLLGGLSKERVRIPPLPFHLDRRVRLVPPAALGLTPANIEP
jgi:hypothetical protein